MKKKSNADKMVVHKWFSMDLYAARPSLHDNNSEKDLAELFGDGFHTVKSVTKENKKKESNRDIYLL